MILSRFVIPASVFITTAALVAFYWFQRETTYKEAQLVVTYSLVMCGLMVALFARPPTRLWAGGAKLVGDRRILWVVGGLSILYFLFATTRLAAYFFQLAALSLPVDYLLVILLVTAWALLLRTLWRLPLLKECVY